MISVEDYVRTGEAMQRMWLTATSLGLNLQPEMTPIIFRWYVQSGRSISAVSKINDGGATLAADLDSLAGVDAVAPLAFLCRVGAGAAPRARSLRRKLDDLMVG